MKSQLKYQSIFFDLDGTLTDPAEGITNAIIYARKKWGLPCEDNSAYYEFIGPPMPQSFVDIWGMSPEDAARFLADYREHYSDIGLFENRPYPGMEELLKKLKAAGAKLYVATTKPTVFAVQILEKFGLAPYFEIISGCELNGDRGLKYQVIEYARDEGHVDMSSAVMVGDRLHDAKGAEICGIPCIGAGYGYGGREELLAAGCIAVADSVAELDALLFE